MSPAGRTATRLWALLVLIGAVIVARATYVTDLSAFPAARTEARHKTPAR
jgi:hypothetical protein